MNIHAEITQRRERVVAAAKKLASRYGDAKLLPEERELVRCVTLLRMAEAQIVVPGRRKAG